MLKQLGLIIAGRHSPVRSALNEIIGWYRSLGLELLEVYGMSENFGYSHANRPGQAKVGTVGMANPGVEHRIERAARFRSGAGPDVGYYKNEKNPGRPDG